MEVARDRTALTRHALSRPWRLALDDGLVRPDSRLFDYGCGKGDDLRLLAAGGFNASGWDPNHRPDAARTDAEIVNLGYAAAQREAEALLLQIGKPGAIDGAIAKATVGKTTPTALYVHLSALERLPLLLRAFAGCGHGYLGAVEGATLIKLYRREPKLSYLAYPDFDRDPHPALDFSFNIDLRELRLKRHWYKDQPNQPVLHRKECYVAEDYPRRTTFARLTKTEEAAGLLDQTDRIGLRHGWETVLAEKGLTLIGHRLVKAPLRP